MRQRYVVGIILATAAVVAVVTPAAAQVTQPAVTPQVSKPPTNKTPPPPPPAPAPANYLIGVDDVLIINVWRSPEVSGEVRVRPDGKITLSVGNDIVALGLTTDELKDKITTELKRFYDEPTVFIQAKEINSRRVFITGNVAKAGAYPLIGPMTVLQLITAAGGLLEFADKKNVMLISATLKTKDGQPLSYKINYKDLAEGKNLTKYNIELRPGDQVIVK